MYKNLGYIVYRTVLEYYSGTPDEDAYGMEFKKINKKKVLNVFVLQI